MNSIVWKIWHSVTMIYIVTLLTASSCAIAMDSAAIIPLTNSVVLYSMTVVAVLDLLFSIISIALTKDNAGPAKLNTVTLR